MLSIIYILTEQRKDPFLLLINIISWLAVKYSSRTSHPCLGTFWDIIAAAWSQAVTTLLEVSALICSMILSSFSAVSLILPKYRLTNRSLAYL